MPKPFSRAVFLVALLAGALGLAAPALAVDTPFSTRYAQTLRGDIRAVGNTLLTCPAAAANCANAQNRTGATLNNNDFNMRNVDVDSDATTFNSSTATLSLPAGATVTWAGLYWSADTTAASGGAAAPTPAERDRVKFAVGAGAYQTMTAAPADLLTSSAQPSRFRGFRDVTSLVPASGSGTYSVANVQAGTGADRFGGWSLVVAYQDAAQPIRRLNVFDGLGTVDATHTFTTTIAPFWTPASGAVTTTFGLLGFEGDAALATETAKFNGTSLSNALNPANNFFNSTISASGAYIGAKTPDYRNQMGIDVDSDTRTGLLLNGQGSAPLSFTSTQDYFMPSALWLVSDEGPAVNTAGPTVGGIARDGSTLTADPGTWSGTPTITYAYQWQRCDSAGANCVDVAGATNPTYTLTPGDVGSTVRVLVTAVNAAGSSAPTASTPTGAVAVLAPSGITVPAVSGVARDDHTLTTTMGGWSGTGPLEYDVQWQRCDSAGAHCADIAGATDWSYVLTGADIGGTVRSEVTASNSAGSAVALSTPTGSVDPDPPHSATVPAISGVARDGQTLSATDGTWTGTTPIASTYQWQRCDAGGASCADITGATSATYTLTGADVAGSVRVQVTATNVAGDATASSAATGAVLADPPANTSVPTLSGTPRDGQTLTLDDGTWTGTGPLGYDVVWQRCDTANCQAVPGETGSSYTLTATDIGATIRALVTASNGVGITGPVATAPTAAVAADPPANTSTPPSVSGNAIDGGTLTADEGGWTGTQPVVFTYQWQRCDTSGLVCTDVTGATDPTYTLSAGDIGSTVRVQVTAANGGGAIVVASPVTALVAAVAPSHTSAPTASGTPADGEVLTASPGAWDGSDPITYTYQWERCDAAGAGCQVIAGATSAAYTLADADAGQTVRVAVTGTNAAGSDHAASAASDVVAGDPPVLDTAPTLSGSAVDGQTLSAEHGDWSGTAPLAYAYQWQRCDAAGNGCTDIIGAGGPAYTLTGSDIDGTVRVAVTVTNGWGIHHANTAPTAVVAAAPPAISIDPAVLGTAVDGQTVTADPGIWSGTPPVSYEYQWRRCDLDGTNCSDISGADEQDYLLTGADTGHGIRVEVTATNAAGHATATSPVASVNAAAPQTTAAPSVSGALRDGQTLTADPGVWSGTAPVSFDYQWLHCDATGQTCALIGGATEPTYTLDGSDVGGQVRVSVVATNSGGTAQDSSPAGPASAVIAADPPRSTSDPVVTGAATDGATLSAGHGGWTGTGPLAYTYQWQHCADDGTACADIVGATAATYALTSTDVAGSVRVEVTATNAAGSDSSVSQPSSAVAAAPPVSATPPAIAGPLVDGGTLTADPGAFTGTTPQTVTYQWQRCDTDGTGCADIPGATASTHELVAADVGAAVQVVVTATNAAGADSATSALSAAIVPLAPHNTSPPSITGAPVVGGALTADPGTWTGTNPTFAYQWQRCDADGADCADILGATDPSYTLVAGDIDHGLLVTVTAGNGAGSAQGASAPTAPAHAAPPTVTAVPTVAGTLEDGQTLTADPGTWSGTPTITYTYQWQRCDADGTHCTAISGETALTYTLTGADVGHPVIVEVTAHNGGGNATAASAAPSAGVAVDPPSSTVPASVTGTAVDGHTLTADPGTWTGTGPIDFTFQWQRCDAAGATCVDVAGATHHAYTLGEDDLGSTVVVVVTAHNGEATTSTSAASDPVAPQAPISTSPPTVSGTVGAGHTLTAGDGTWDGTAPFTYGYQWQRCDASGSGCADISGADESIYDLRLADVGHAIVLVVTATGSGGSVGAPSAASVATAPFPPTNTVVPTAPSGTPVAGGTLTAADGTWTGAATITLEYQWQRCDADGTRCSDISGATDPTYTPSDGDVGHAIAVVVTATNPGGPTSQVSTPTAAVAAAPPVNTTAPSVTGTPADGAILTADHGAWTGTAPITYEYQWQRCAADGTGCVDIAGANDPTYTAGSNDIGHAVTVVVTASNAGGDIPAAAGAASDPVLASAPSNTTPPSLSGTVSPGGTLTAGTGTWAGTGPFTYEYQWQRCDDDGTHCIDVTDATGDTYTLAARDEGHTVVVVVTATNAVGHDSATSDPSALLPAPPHNATKPEIAGDEPAVGDTLSVDTGAWTGTGPFTYEYQWQSCDFFGANCVDIAGATGDSYTVTDADAGHVLTVVVTATNAAGDATTTSVPSAAVQAPAGPTPTPTPTATPPAPATPIATPAPRRATPPIAHAAPPSGSAPGAFAGDLGDVPGSLVSAASCQQLSGNAKFRRLALRGIGTVRVRAYTAGPTTKLTPILVTTQISHARTKRIRVRYTLDGRKLRAGRKPRYAAAIAPSRLRRIGVHTLRAKVTGTGRAKHAKAIVLKLKTVSCRTIFTAQRWRTTAGAGLRLRIDARTALSRLAFTVPAALLPRRTARRRTVGFMRVFVAGQARRKRYALRLAPKGRGTLLLRLHGGPTVRSVRGGLRVSGLPARSAVAELTIYRVTERDGATRTKRYRVRAQVLRGGARTLKLSVRPRPPR